MNPSIIGADLGGTKLLFVCGQKTLRVETGSGFSPHDFTSALLSFIKTANLQPTHLGIAVPGLVDTHGHVIACDVLPTLKGWRPADALAGFRYHTTVLNDVKAALLEEMHDAPANFTGGIVMAGTAIGAAFITHGHPLEGACGWAGELGYLPYLTPDGVKRLDEVAGGAAITAKLNTDAPTLARLASAAHPQALRTIHEAGQALGIGLAATINLLNPAKLAVAGGTLNLPGYWPAAINSAQSHTIPELWNACELIQARAGAYVVARGAIRAATASRPSTIR